MGKEEIEEDLLRYELRYCEDVICNEFCVEMIFELIQDIVRSITDGYLQSRYALRDLKDLPSLSSNEE